MPVKKHRQALQKIQLHSLLQTCKQQTCNLQYTSLLEVPVNATKCNKMLLNK